MRPISHYPISAWQTMSISIFEEIIHQVGEAAHQIRGALVSITIAS